MIRQDRLNEMLSDVADGEGRTAFRKEELAELITELQWRRRRQPQLEQMAASRREPVQRIRDVCVIFLAIVATVYYLFFA